MSDPIYFDFNATTPLLPEVIEAMTAALSDFGNPSSGHVFGRRAKEKVEHARSQLAALLNCAIDELLFTSGGTESNNLALFGLPRSSLIISVVEHPAIAAPAERLEAQGLPVVRWPVDGHGVVRVGTITPGTLVSVMHSNNETGVLQPIAELARLAHRHGALLHTDASQSVGKVAIDVRALEVDALTVCGHKLYAPKGVGALYVRKGLSLRPFMLGASHERGLRPGTENVASIVGLGVAAELARRTSVAEEKRVSALRDELISRLRLLVPGLAVNGDGAPRLPNTASVRFPRVLGSAVLQASPGIAASTGSACHDGHETASAVILAMGVPASEAEGTVRLSLGRTTTSADVAAAADALGTAWQRIAATQPMR